MRGEVVGCDALQVYRGFDVGTAKPSAEERAAAPHHLVDHVDPRRDYSAADYVRDAESAIAAIAKRGAVPIVVGGTGMYLRSLLRGLVDAPPRDPALRARLRRSIDRFGAPALHRRLAAVDPASAARIRPADAQRVVRAFELALAGGRTWSARLEKEGTWDRGIERFPSLKIGLDLDRRALTARLDARVERFFEAGWIDEVRDLLAAGIPPDANAFQAIGYREIRDRLTSGEDPAASREEIRTRTRRFAKRQRTWFRSEPSLHWLDAAESVETLVSRVVSAWEESA